MASGSDHVGSHERAKADETVSLCHVHQPGPAIWVRPPLPYEVACAHPDAPDEKCESDDHVPRSSWRGHGDSCSRLTRTIRAQQEREVFRHADLRGRVRSGVLGRVGNGGGNGRFGSGGVRACRRGRADQAGVGGRTGHVLFGVGAEFGDQALAGADFFLDAADVLTHAVQDLDVGPGVVRAAQAGVQAVQFP